MKTFFFYKWQIKLGLLVLAIFTVPTNNQLMLAGSSKYNTVYNMWQWTGSMEDVEKFRTFFGIIFISFSYFFVLSIIFYLFYKFKNRKKLI